MNLKKIVEFLEKRALLLGITLVLALGGYFAIQKIYPSKPSQKLPEPQFYSQTSTPTTSLGVPLPREKILPVFLFKEKTLTSNQVGGLARSLGFEEKSQTSQDPLWGTMYRWSESGKTLTARANGQAISFSYDSPTDVLTTFGGFPDPEKAKDIVLEFLKKEGLYSSLLNFAAEKTRALNLVGARPKVTTLNEADALEIHFRGQIESYPLLAEEGSTTDPVVAWIDRGGEILKLDWHALGEVEEKVSDYPLKSLTEVKEDLKAGKAALVHSEAETTETLKAAAVTGVNLTYLKSQQYLLPVFALEGQAELQSGKRVEVTLYLPAISEEFFEAD